MKKGFTLVEVLVAIIILAAVIGAAAIIEIRNVNSSSQNKRQLEALSLAQEGLNLSKSVSDSDKLNSSTDFPTAANSYWLQLVGGKWQLDLASNAPASKQCTGTKGPGEKIIVGGRTYCREIIINNP